MRSRLVVTTPATSTSLTTLDAARAELAGEVDSTLLQRWIRDASAAVARHLGFPPAREAVTETFWLEGGRPSHLPLARTPVAAIASVTVDGTVLAAEDYTVDGAGLLTRLSSDQPVDWWARKIDVAYSAGWLLPGQAGANLPHEIERATIITVMAWAAGQGRDPQLRSESADGIGSQSWLDPVAEHGALPWAAAQLLAAWRRQPIA